MCADAIPGLAPWADSLGLSGPKNLSCGNPTQLCLTAFELPSQAVAEGEGFEPSVSCPTPDFESGTIDHSATLPFTEISGAETSGTSVLGKVCVGCFLRPLPASHRTITHDPGRTSVGRRIASQLAKRTQPALCARPMVLGMAVPWRPMPDLLMPHQMMPTGLFGPGGS